MSFQEDECTLERPYKSDASSLLYVKCLLSQMQAPISDIVKQNVALELYTLHNCCPVFLGKDLKDKYYKGAFCQYEMFELSGGGAIGADN